ncbi:uncharacterized protein METZ01_LOCUS131127, partial [marine metagenome]
VGYNLGFAATVCLACALVVSTAAVSLLDRQERNAALDKQKNVLLAAGLASEDESLGTDEMVVRFASITQRVISVSTGRGVE